MGFAGDGFSANPDWRSTGAIATVYGNWIGQISVLLRTKSWSFARFLLRRCTCVRAAGSLLIRLIVAIVLSGVIFSAAHLGSGLFKADLSGFELLTGLAQTFIYGLASAWIYLRTLNPFVAAAFHALSNYLEPAYYSAHDMFPNETWFAYLITAIAFGAVWPLFQRPAKLE